MGEDVFMVASSELTTVRVTCKSCGVTVEVRYDNLGPTFKKDNCQFCGAKILSGHDTNALTELQSALMMLAKADGLRVEFPVERA